MSTQNLNEITMKGKKDDYAEEVAVLISLYSDVLKNVFIDYDGFGFDLTAHVSSSLVTEIITEMSSILRDVVFIHKYKCTDGSAHRIIVSINGSAIYQASLQEELLEIVE